MQHAVLLDLQEAGRLDKDSNSQSQSASLVLKGVCLGLTGDVSHPILLQAQHSEGYVHATSLPH